MLHRWHQRQRWCVLFVKLDYVLYLNHLIFNIAGFEWKTSQDDSWTLKRKGQQTILGQEWPTTSHPQNPLLFIPKPSLKLDLGLRSHRIPHSQTDSPGCNHGSIPPSLTLSNKVTTPSLRLSNWGFSAVSFTESQRNHIVCIQDTNWDGIRPFRQCERAYIPLRQTHRVHVNHLQLSLSGDLLTVWTQRSLCHLFSATWKDIFHLA